MKTYSELIKLKTFEERYDYLKLDGSVGFETFGSERYLNQRFYTTPEWRTARRKAIVRDHGCDMGIEDRPINSKIIIHHIDPITIDDVLNRSSKLFDLDNLICVSFDTHLAIHYGDKGLLTPTKPIERTPNDTCPWRN